MRWAARICVGFGLLVGLADVAYLVVWREGGAPPASKDIAEAPPSSPEDERKSFHLPPGFEAQLVAAEPLVRKPLNLAFDGDGRLWVTSSLEYPIPAGEGTKTSDAVTILDDFGEDGRARSITRFADGLDIPIGILPLSRGEALAYHIPEIVRLTDTDGDGHADRRTPLYGTFGFDDTHGMVNALTWGFDGWIYACHGFANTSNVRGSDGESLELKSGSTFRFKPDGTHVERYASGVQNPFGLAFDPLGHLYTCDSHTWPIWQLIRGGCYPGHGQTHDGLGFGPALMDFRHGSTAIAGIVYYAADHFPAPYRDTVFVGNVVTNRINHDRLEWTGSSPKAVPLPDFLVSDDPWFRPVDIKLGPDGALYVADFYNRIIGHYEVALNHPGRDHERGRIWRIVYRGPGGRGTPAPRLTPGAEPSVAKSVAALGHPNLTVRMGAANALVARGGRGVIVAVRSLFAEPTSPLRRAHGLWVLERLGALEPGALVASARDRDRVVRVHAMRVLGERAAWTAGLREAAIAGLNDRDAFVARAAAEALGRHPSPAHLAPLLARYNGTAAGDTHLVHTLRIALRDQFRASGTWAEVARTFSALEARELSAFAFGVPSESSARYVLASLRARPDAGEDLERSLRHIARYGGSALAAELLEFARRQRPGDLAHQAKLARAIQQGREERGEALGKAERAWAVEVSRALLATRRPESVRDGIALAGALALDDLRAELTTLASSGVDALPVRLAALDALAAMGASPSLPLFGRLLLDRAEPMAIRDAAARGLGRIDDERARTHLLAGLAIAPLPVQHTIARALAGTRSGAEALVTVIGAGSPLAWLADDEPLRRMLAQAGIADERIGSLARGGSASLVERQTLIDRRKAGYAASRADPARGAEVFKAHCASCHPLGGVGATIGPPLDGVGKRGSDRVIEDILDPSRVIDPAFQVTSLALTDGRLVSGLLLREEGEVLIVSEGPGKELRVPKAQVEGRSRVPLSPMPDDFAARIPEADFDHLLSYLIKK